MRAIRRAGSQPDQARPAAQPACVPLQMARALAGAPLHQLSFSREGGRGVRCSKQPVRGQQQHSLTEGRHLLCCAHSLQHQLGGFKQQLRVPAAAAQPRLGPVCVCRFSIINSCVTVLLLTGFLATILMRVLRADFIKYSREDRECERDSDLCSSNCLLHWNVLAHLTEHAPRWCPGTDSSAVCLPTISYMLPPCSCPGQGRVLLDV